MPLLFWFDLSFVARAEILEKISLGFWSKRWHQKDILKLTDLYDMRIFSKFQVNLQTAELSLPPYYSIKSKSWFLITKVYLAMGIFHSFCTLSKHQLIPFTKEVLTPWNWCMRNYFQGNRIHVLSMWSLLTRARKNK